jgi:hypothetical protein
MACHVTIHRFVNIHPPDDWQLSFQLVTYIHETGLQPEDGYRFIWIRKDGSLQAARGQARLECFGDMRRLQAKALIEGWLFETKEEVAAYIAGFTNAPWSPPAGPTEQIEATKAAYITGVRHRIDEDRDRPAA